MQPALQKGERREESAVLPIRRTTATRPACWSSHPVIRHRYSAFRIPLLPAGEDRFAAKEAHGGEE